MKILKLIDKFINFATLMIIMTLLSKGISSNDFGLSFLLVVLLTMYNGISVLLLEVDLISYLMKEKKL